MQIELGREVYDKVTGFQGVVVARAEYLLGESTVMVQPISDSESKMPDPQWFSESRVSLVVG